VNAIEIIGALGALPLNDLRAVQVALDKELLKYSSLDKDLYFLLFEVTGAPPIKADKFARSELGVQWRRNQLVFDQFMAKLVGNTKPRQVVIKALKKFLLEMLVDDIKLKGLPLSMRVVVQNLNRIETTFRRNFPGYLESGLGNLIIKRLGGNRNDK